MAVCSICGKQRNFIMMGSDGICVDCHAEEAHRLRLRELEFGDDEQQQARELDEARLARIILTTETAHNLPVDQRLDIVSAEVVIGLHLFKDIAAVWRDAFGGRSKVMQNGLREARQTALTELRREAVDLGADAVVGIDLDYSEISGAGKNMLFLVASGTAVTLRANGDSST